MRSNGRLPNGAVNGVLGTFFDRKACDAVIDGGSTDPLRVEACEHMAQTLPLVAHQRLSAQVYIVKIQHELRFGDLQGSLDRRHGNAGGLGIHNEQRQGRAPRLIHRLAAGDNHDGV